MKYVYFTKEHSGFPSICRPVQEGGLGFDYRLNMDIPRQWIKVSWTVFRKLYFEKIVLYASKRYFPFCTCNIHFHVSHVKKIYVFVKNNNCSN